MTYRNQVNADDMQNIVIKSLLRGLNNAEPIYMRLELSWPDGSLHWIKTQGKVINDEKDQPVRMLGNIIRYN